MPSTLLPESDTVTTSVDTLQTLSEWAASLRYEALPADVHTHTGWILADTVAAIVGGSAEPELRRWVARQTGGGSATLVGLGQRTQPATAALINGTAGTFLEMDEGNRFSRGHPAVHVLPALLALADTQRLARADFLAALVVGYEVGSRIGAASQLRSAMHPHGTWGTIGAAAACARAQAYAPDLMRETINVSASSGASGMPAALAKSLAVPSGTSPSEGSTSAGSGRCARVSATSLRVPSPPAAMMVSTPWSIASAT